MEWSWWATSNNACEPGEQLIVLANGDDESDLVGWSLLLLAATVRSFAHMPLGISDRNSAMVVDCFNDIGFRRIRCCTVLYRSEVMVSSLPVMSWALLVTHTWDLSAGSPGT